MQIFKDLSSQVNEQWQSGSPEDFPAIATRILQNFSYGLTLDQFNRGLAEWIMNEGLPEQINVQNTFGQPPVTIFNNGRYVVDLYIWQNFDTSIHSHGFRGAFRVLHGSSLHEEFKVRTIEAIAEDAALVDLGEPMLEILRAGDTRTILPDGDLTHQLVHLENPTITLTLKTINESTLSQWHHFPYGLAMKKRNLAPALIKQIYYYQYLMSQDEDLADQFIETALGRLDISTQMNLCETLSSGGLELSDVHVDGVLARVFEKQSETEWFRRYQDAQSIHFEELHFERTDDPVSRLIGHFINQGRPASAVDELIAAVAGKALSKTEVKARVLALIDLPGIFAAEADDEERTEIKELVAYPDARIPNSLSEYPIAKIRAFLK